MTPKITFIWTSSIIEWLNGPTMSKNGSVGLDQGQALTWVLGTLSIGNPTKICFKSEFNFKWDYYIYVGTYGPGFDHFA